MNINAALHPALEELTEPHRIVLELLFKGESLNVSDLMNELERTATAIRGYLSTLEHMGLVSRSLDQGYQRGGSPRLRYSLTSNGKALFSGTGRSAKMR